MGNLGVTLSPSVSIWYEKAPRQGASASIFHGLKPALRRADKTGIMHLRDVAGIWKISWAFGLSFLLGCTGPIDPSVEFLSFGMPSLKSSVPSPFEQEFENGHHVIFAGECSQGVSNLEIRINDLAWVPVPSSAANPISGVAPNGRTYSESAPSDPTYDVDCSDGRFRFYLYAHQIDNSLIDQGRSESIDDEDFIQKISLRGLNGPFVTQPLVFTQAGRDSNRPDADGFNFHLSSNRIGTGLCVPIHIFLTKGTEFNVSNSKERELTLEKSNFASQSSFRFYSDSSCSQLIPESSFRTSIVIPAGTTHKTVFMKGTTEEYPGAMGLFNTRLIFLEAARNFPSGTPAQSRDVEVRNAGVVTKIRFMDALRFTSVGRCEEVDIQATDTDGVLSHQFPGGVDLVVTPSSVHTSRIRFVESCALRSQSITQLVFRTNIDSTIRLAYVVEQQDEESISLAGSGVTFEGQPHIVNPWTAAHSLEIVDDWAALQIPVMAPDCRPLTLQMKSSSGSPVPASAAPESFTVNLWQQSGPGAEFYSTPNCTTGVPAENGLAITFAPGEASKTIYWKQTDNSSGYFRFVRSWSPRFRDSWKGLELDMNSRSNLFLTLQLAGFPLTPDWQSIWRLPRAPSSPGLGPTWIAPISGSASGAVLNLVGDVNGAGVGHVGEQSGRRIHQDVINLDGSAGYQLTSAFSGTRTSGYVFFRFLGNGGDRVLVSFQEALVGANLVITPDGKLALKGAVSCTPAPDLSLNLRNGGWHLVQFSLDSSLVGTTLQVRTNDGGLQSCSAGVLGLGGVLGAVTFGQSSFNGTAGFVGQIAEMGLTYHDYLDTSFSQFEVPYYLLQRYPATSPP